MNDERSKQAKFVPYEKMSKKNRRKLDLLSRRSWNGVDPVTRRADTDKRYKRGDKHKKNYLHELD